MLDVVRGLVLYTVDVGEHDKMLTVYTHERGLISAYVKGAKAFKGKRNASCAHLAYSEMILFEKGDKLWVREANLIRYFQSPLDTVEFLTVSNYVADVLRHVCTTEPDETVMRLALNTLYALETEKYDHRIIKAAFELRLLSIIGFMPQVASCSECGGGSSDFYLDVMSGTLECADCHAERASASDEGDGELHLTCLLTNGARIAMQYAIHSPLERLYSFSLSGEDLTLFARAAETYTVHQLERSFITLDYYHAVCP